jgi:hypothetical protein
MMNISPEERIAIEKLAEKITEAKISAFNMMALFSKMPEDELRHTGHKTQADGINYTLKHALKEIAKAEENFFRLFPDK